MRAVYEFFERVYKYLFCPEADVSLDPREPIILDDYMITGAQLKSILSVLKRKKNAE
jgi:hypothetical protein